VKKGKYQDIWTTHNEQEFIKGLSKETLATYILHIDSRDDWGDMDKKAVVAYARKRAKNV
jgi:hypothetical protein